MRVSSRTITVVCLWLTCWCVSQAILAYEAAPTVSVSEILPPELSHSIRHRVAEVEVRRGTYHFTLESDFGIYHIATLGLLRERVREILILANVVNQYAAREENRVNPNRGQLQIRSDRALDILSRPVDTAGNLAGQLADNLGATLLGAAPEAARNQIYSGGESSDPVTALHKRNLAGQWQLDVYSTNPKVQEFLDAMARARSAGTISAGTPALNRQPVKPLRIADAALDAELTARLKSDGPAALQTGNDRILADLNISPELRAAFLQQPVFSPRHKTRISHYLSQLAGVANLAALIAAANNSKEESEALAYEHLVMMLAQHQRAGPRLRALVAGQSGGRPHLEAITEDGQMLYLLVQDVLYWTENTARRFEAIPGKAEQADAKNWRLISSGSVTEEARARLAERQFEIEERYLD